MGKTALLVLSAVLLLGLVGAALTFAAAGAKNEPAEPTAAEREFIMDVLRKIQPGTMDLEAAEAALVAAGKDILPALRAVVAQPDRLVGDDELTSNVIKPPTGGTVIDMTPRPQRVENLRRHRLSVLNAAVSRLSWDVDPAKAVEQWTARIKDAQGQAIKLFRRPSPVTDESLAKALPDRMFYSLLIPQYPVARMLPEPLSANNLFAIDRKGEVIHITTKESLEEFFRRHMSAVRDEPAARAAAAAWLRLTQDLANDGMFQFDISAESLKVEKAEGGGLRASGRAEVKPAGGNSGAIAAALSFDATGKLLKVDQQVNLKAGIRPICQATKLLDADPVVRKMAEQDLLVMGLAVEDYLREQRAQAAPALQAAIDRIWQRILQRESDLGPGG